MSHIERLFDQFPPVSTKEWMDMINADLKGADFNKKLVWRTNEGFEVKPFYRKEDLEDLMYINTLPGEYPYLRGTKTRNNDWLIRQNIEVSDYSEANLKALMIMMKGVDSVGLKLIDPGSINEKNFDILMKGIQFKTIELNFFSNGKAKEIIDLFCKYIKKSGSDPLKICGAFEADPLGRLIVNGTICIPIEEGFDFLASLVRSVVDLPDFRVVHINASNFTNAGADIVQEIAFGISMGSEYMVQLTERGISADEAARKIRFSFGTGSTYFPEIAKLRAARLLWSAVTKGFHPENPENIKMDIHCVTSEWNKTVYDPYVNLLRTQTEAMSAIIGGTDSLTVEPFDIVFRHPDEFSERIARNQQLILREEAYFDKVADPAAGSYYIENLTNLIAECAWKLFLEVEERGGFLTSIKSGFIQKKISESATGRRSSIASGKEILLGTNRFPDLNEKTPSGTDLRRVFKAPVPEKDLFIEPIKLFRGSEEFERRRLGSDKAREI